MNGFYEVTAQGEATLACRSLSGNEEKEIGKHLTLSVDAGDVWETGGDGCEGA